MTSITLPLKKFPGQEWRVPTFFGGRSFFTPMILLLTTPFTLYLYYLLSCDSLFSYNLLGFLPYVLGIVLIADCIKKSKYAVEGLVEASLSEANKIFDETMKNLRGLFILKIIYITLFSLLIILYGEISLLIIGLSSVISIGFTFSSLFTPSDLKRLFIYICFVFASEAMFLLITFRGLWMLYMVFLVGVFLNLFLCLHRIDRYDLRSFFEKVVN
jgi:hypothetical protein